MQIEHWRAEVFVRACVCVSMMPVFVRRLITCLFSEPSSRGVQCRSSSSSVPPPGPEQILILNVCSCSWSGRVGDCLLFPPSGHLQLHLIQMPICSNADKKWLELAARSASLFVHFASVQYKGAHVCTRTIPRRRGFTQGLLSLVHR